MQALMFTHLFFFFCLDENTEGIKASNESVDVVEVNGVAPAEGARRMQPVLIGCRQIERKMWVIIGSAEEFSFFFLFFTDVMLTSYLLVSTLIKQHSTRD